MQSTFETVLPIFGLVLCGYLVARARLLSEEGLRGLTGFVFYVAIPALLFRIMAASDLPRTADLGVLLAYFGGGVAVFALAAALGRAAFKLGLPELAVMGMGTAFSNAVMLGIPVVLTVFGEPGLVPLTLIITFQAAVLFPLTAVLIEVGRGGEGGIGRVAGATARSLAGNPVILAILAGVAFGATGLGVPTPFQTFLKLLAGAAAPCALFALGGSLAAFNIAGDLKQSASVVLLKLFLHPLLVWLLARYVFELTPLWTAVATVTAAMPCGANVFVFARQYDVFVNRTAAALLISTALSVVTVAALIASLTPV